MIIGGIAVIAYGIPRQTIDIDATVSAAQTTLDELLQRLAKHDITPRIDDAVRFAQEHQILLLTHTPTEIPLDISLAWLPFEEAALARARVVDFGGVRIAVASPGDLIVYKAIAWRGRDKADIERLLVAQYDEIDLNQVRARVREFAEVLEDPDRPAQLEQLIQRVGRLAR